LQIPSADLKPLYNYVQDCRECQVRLAAANQNLADDAKKIAALTSERDAAVTAAKGGTFLAPCAPKCPLVCRRCCRGHCLQRQTLTARFKSGAPAAFVDRFPTTTFIAAQAKPPPTPALGLRLARLQRADSKRQAPNSNPSPSYSSGCRECQFRLDERSHLTGGDIFTFLRCHKVVNIGRGSWLLAV